MLVEPRCERRWLPRFDESGRYEGGLNAYFGEGAFLER
jgi:hypothetical protein